MQTFSQNWHSRHTLFMSQGLYRPQHHLSSVCFTPVSVLPVRSQFKLRPTTWPHKLYLWVIVWSVQSEVKTILFVDDMCLSLSVALSQCSPANWRYCLKRCIHLFSNSLWQPSYWAYQTGSISSTLAQIQTRPIVRKVTNLLTNKNLITAFLTQKIHRVNYNILTHRKQIKNKYLTSRIYNTKRLVCQGVYIDQVSITKNDISEYLKSITTNNPQSQNALHILRGLAL